MGMAQANKYWFVFEFWCYLSGKWKSALILCMLHRAKLICSSDILFFKEVDQLRSLFLSNNYTLSFFNKILSQFLLFFIHTITAEVKW